MRSLRWRFLCLSLLSCLLLTPVLAAGPPPDEVVRLQLEESLTQLESDLAAEPPAAKEIRRGLTELRYLSSLAAVPVDDLLTRLEGQLGRLAGGAEPADRLPELRRRVEPTVSALRAKLAATGEAGRPAAPTADSLAAPPDNDSCASATAVTAGTVFGDTTGAGNDGSASCGNSASSPDAWYSYTATSDGLVTFDTAGSDLDTVLSLHSSCPDADGGHELTCNDDFEGGFDSLVGRQMSSGDTVLIRVSGAGGATGGFQINIDDSAGGIGGVVTKDGTGEPLAGASIRVWDAYGWLEGQTTTANDGTYLVPGLETQDHQVEAYHGEYVREIWDDVQCIRQCYPLQEADFIPVAGDLVDGIDFALSPGGTITGVLTDARTGEPLTAYLTQVQAYDTSGKYLRTAGTDQAGHYALGGLPDEPVFIVASSTTHQNEAWEDIPCERSCDPTTGTALQIDGGASLDGIDFGLTRLGSIVGTLTGTDGTPLPYQIVTAVHAEDQTVVESRTSGESEIVFQGLPSGDYFLYSDLPGNFINEVYPDVLCLPDCPVLSGVKIPVSLDTTTAGIDLELSRLGYVTGTVVTQDGGLFDGYIEFYDSAGRLVWDKPIFTDWGYSQLYPGTYYVRARSYWEPRYETTVFEDLGCQPTCDVTQGTPIQVGPDVRVTGLTISIDVCTADSYEDLTDLTVGDAEAYEACRTIRVGEGVTVGNGGHLSLTAGRKVSFGDGFRVEPGGSLAVTIDPDVASN